MFDIGLLEIVIVTVLALLVLGPERLPKVVSKVGHWVGRARAMARSLKVQFEREARLDELKEDLEEAKEDVSAPLSEDFISAAKAAQTPADKNDD